MNLLLFLFIVPALIRVVGIYLKPEAQILSLGILKSSLTFLFVGSLLIAFAASSPLLIACKFDSSCCLSYGIFNGL